MLHNLHPNIKVLRYPKSNFDLLWTPHEKMVVLDQYSGYIGGIDLCWGRYDNSNHNLYDSDIPADQLWPGIDYGNCRRNEIKDVEKVMKETINRSLEARLPWHDIHCYLEGQVISDLSKHFIEKWSFISETKSKYPGFEYFDKNTLEALDEEYDNEIKECVAGSNPLQGLAANDRGLFLNNDSTFSLSVRKDNSTSIFHRVGESPFEDINDDKSENLLRKTTDIITPSRNMNSISNFKESKRKSIETFRISKRANMTLNDSVTTKLKKVFRTTKTTQINLKIRYKLFSEKNDTLNLSCQLVRSASIWSMGIENVENSILESYYDIIENSKSYIYIENQFFISRAFNDEESDSNPDLLNYPVINRIALKIRERIERAWKNKDKFKVYIFLPLIPGFDGHISENSTIQTIMRYTYKTICRGKGFSLMERLYAVMGDDLSNYIAFLSLRTHQSNSTTSIPTTEMIYIHSKVRLIK